MTVVENQLLLCLAAYANGDKKARLQDGFTSDALPALISLAYMHKLTAVVYDKLPELPEFSLKSYEAADELRTGALLDLSTQCIKTAALLRLTAALEAASVRYVVVKGVVCRELYSLPDIRNSADEDIYILPEDVKKAEAVLSSIGYLKGDAHWTDRESALHIELHQHLTSRDSDSLEPYFASQLENRIKYSVGEAYVYTFPPTVNLIFMVSHAKKHFLAGGFGIRTLCDAALFAVKYSNDIDRNELNRQLERINAKPFFEQILAISRDFLCLDIYGWDIADVRSGEDLLEDILEAGVYGQSSLSRIHSSTLTVAEAENGRSALNLLRALFPEAGLMKSRYPFARKHPVLLPAAYCKRLVDYAFELVRSKNGESSVADSLKLHKKRSALIEKYGLFDSRTEK